MEKKTMGAFLTVLRKAKGMTQKELAEQLNVSDKTVSRWEREDGYPDLALIPVIAEIFDVTCDELLRGERRTAGQGEASAMPDDGSARGEKQRQRLLKLTVSHYQNQTFLAMGISAAGVAVALIANLAFLRGTLGFLLGTIFYIISMVLLAIWKNQALLSVEDSGISEAELSAFRRQVIDLTRRSAGVTAGCLGFACPMLLAGSHGGLPSVLCAALGLTGILLALTVYGVVCWFLTAREIRCKVYLLEAKEETACWHNHGLQKKCFCRALAALMVTLAFHAFGSEMIWSQGNLVKGHRFEDYDSFASFMGQDIQESHVTITTPFAAATEHVMAPQAQPGQDEEASTRTLEDANGTVVCTYTWRNLTVSTIRPTPGEGTALPIVVITHAQWAFARNTAAIINTAYCILYPLELLTAVWLYVKKKIK